MMKRILLVVLVMALCPGLTFGDDQPGAAASEQLQATLQQKAVEAHRQRIEARLVAAREARAQVQAELRQTELQLRQKTGRLDVGADSLRQAASRTENALEALELDTAGASARMEALAKTLAEVAKKGEDVANKDEVYRQLALVVKAREEELAMKQKLAEQGTVSQEEMSNARARVAEARAKMAERRMMVSASAGGGALADWNREMLDLTLDAQEREARTKLLKDRLERLRSGLGDVDRLEELKAAVADARARVAQAQRELDGL